MLGLLAFAALAPGLALGCPPNAMAPPASPPIGRLSFRSFGAADGLDDLAATLLAQDGDGFLWVGTQSGGVFRYDGARFQGYGREQGLPSDLVRALAVAPDGALWVGTSGGVAVRVGDRFEAVDPAAGLGATQITALAFDGAGTLWVGTTQGLLRREHGGRFEGIAGWSGREISALEADPGGGILAAHDGRLDAIGGDGDTARWGPDDGLDGSRIVSVVRDGEGRLWVKSLGGLHVRAREGGPFVDETCLLHAQGRDSLMSVDRRGDLLLPTGGGVLRVRKNEIEVLDRGRGLPTDFANQAFEDREGSLWIASVGVHEERGRGLWSAYGSAEGVPNNIVWSIARGPDGRLYAGTEAGLGRSTAHGWETVPGTGGLTFGALRFAGDGGLWSTGSAQGLLRLDPTSGALTRYGAAAGLASSDITLQLAITRDGEIWVSTRRDGLYLGHVDASPLHLSPFPLPDGDPHERVNQIVEGGDHRVWFAGTHGLAVRDGAALRRFTTKDGLSGDAIGAIVTRRSGEVCVAYRGHEGVTCFRYQSDGLRGVHSVDVQQGRRAVQFLGEDAAGRLWAGTSSGVSVVSERGVDVFGTADGTPGDDSAELAFLAEADGETWIGTSTGLGRFDGARYDGPAPPPKAIIVSARLGDAALSPPFDAESTAPFGQGSLAARFSVLSFLDPARIHYETRILGADPRWRETGITQAQYGALAPGRYRFEVRARAGSGPFGEVAGLSLQVTPAWWQSWWFRATLGAAALAVVVGGVRLRVRALKARNVELQTLVAARTADLEQAHQKIAEAEKLSALGRMLAQLSHELNNPVNVISNNVEPLQEYGRDLVTALTECRALAGSSPEARARLDDLWESLELDFKMGDIGNAIRVVSLAADRIAAVHADLRTFMHGGRASRAMGDILEPLRETVAMVRTTLGRGVDVVEAYEPIPPIAFDRGRMNQVFLNLLQNAADAVDGRGTIRVEAGRTGDLVEIVISDSGPGVARSVRARIFEPFFTTKDVGHGTGLGLAICRSIVVHDHGGQIELDHTHTSGARFVVRLPIAPPEA